MQGVHDLNKGFKKRCREGTADFADLGEISNEDSIAAMGVDRAENEPIEVGSSGFISGPSGTQPISAPRQELRKLPQELCAPRVDPISFLGRMAG